MRQNFCRLVFLFAFAATVVLGASFQNFARAQDDRDEPDARVELAQPMTVLVRLPGVVKSAGAVEVRNTLSPISRTVSDPGRFDPRGSESRGFRRSSSSFSRTVSTTTSIAFLAEQGKRVEKGEVVARLDDSYYQSQKRDQMQALEKAQESLASVQSEAAQLQKQCQNEIAAAQAALETAKLAQRKELAAIELEARTTEGDIRVARERLAAAKAQFEYWEKHENGSPVEASRARVAVVENEEAIKAAETKLAFLSQEFKAHQTAAALQAILERTAALGQVERQCAAQLEAAAARIEKEKHDVKSVEGRIEEIENQIALCTLVAPQAGLVEIAESSFSSAQREVMTRIEALGGRGVDPAALERLRKRAGVDADGADAILSVGERVRSGQTIVRITDPTQLAVRVSLPESIASTISKDQRATVRFDDLPEETVRAELKIIERATVDPREGRTRGGLVRGVSPEFEAIVALEKTPPTLKPGMKATVEFRTPKTPKPMHK